MKISHWFLPFVLISVWFVSCNKEEGPGGSSSLEGYVYQIEHYDDNYSFRTDTFPAVNEGVYLVFGDHDGYFGEDVDTDGNGLYRFDYLRKGNYRVYAFSGFADGRKTAVVRKVNVSGGLNRADTIFIHTGKANGTAMVKGSVSARYYHNGAYRDQGPGTGMRAYIRYAGEDAFFNDTRVGGGVFVFQKLLPGDYEVAVESENPATEKVELITKSIKITETGIIYELPETFEVSVAV
ncbi:MAG: carboxypeptidase-like regulatory domain-containing protein [Dysgonamonadaceae bacterium]|jgi:hypothetical protein|nr:carboxypeptidase-like regulatory domain-containing protein [Dysgonamonadaceae bacterium]